MEAVKRLRIAYTPDSDDAFYYDALETGHVELPGYELAFYRQPMSVLNRAALHGEYEITAISSVLYPQIARHYAILSVGASVGRGYGPVLVSREPRTLADLAGRPVGVGGIPTTGWFLLRCLCSEAVPIEMPFDRIAAAVASGELEAGVMIHEELLYYPRLGLQCVVDLGAEWCQRNGLPLPVGLNVIRRDLGVSAMQRICSVLRHSLRHALENPCEPLSRGPMHKSIRVDVRERRFPVSARRCPHGAACAARPGRRPGIGGDSPASGHCGSIRVDRAGIVARRLNLKKANPLIALSPFRLKCAHRSRFLLMRGPP